MIWIWLSLAIGLQQDAELGVARGWVQENCESILEAHLSLGTHSLVIARAFEDYAWERHEQWFCIGQSREAGLDKLVAEVRSPVNLSILDQITMGHILDPAAACEDLGARVEVEAVVISEADCPGLRSLVESFPSVRPDFPLGDTVTIRLHPRVREVIGRGVSETVDLVSTDPESPVSIWFDHSIQRLQQCARVARPENRRASRGNLEAQLRCAEPNE